jgi:hypothetical protein
MRRRAAISSLSAIIAGVYGEYQVKKWSETVSVYPFGSCNLPLLAKVVIQFGAKRAGNAISEEETIGWLGNTNPLIASRKATREPFDTISS